MNKVVTARLINIRQVVKISVLVISVVIISGNKVHAQFTAEERKGSKIGIDLVFNSFLGDIGGRPGPGKKFLKDVNTNMITSGIALKYLYPLNPVLAFRFNYNYGKLAAADYKLGPTDGSGRYIRNLSFRSSLHELSTGFQLNFSKQQYDALQQEVYNRFSAFLYTGVGVFFFNPTATLDGNIYHLRDFSLEGQGMQEAGNVSKYATKSLCIPVFAGVEYMLQPGLSIVAELQTRKSFTDYIDDASKKYIDPALFDKYFTPEKARIAKALHDRSGELNGGVNRLKQGELRGKPAKDTWIALSVGIVFRLKSS